MQYFTNYSLKNHNTFRLDSIAKEIWFPETFGELQSIIMKEKDFTILACGTNVLLRPEINKVICLTKLPKFIEFNKKGVFVSPNVSTSRFIMKMMKKSYKNLEGLIGIPGTLGGAICMNAGSGKYSISDYLHSVKTYNLNGSEIIYNKEALNLKRRYSILQDNKQIINSICFQFVYGAIDYLEIENVIKQRKSIPSSPSAGGIFKNWHELKPYKNKLIGLKAGDAEVSDKVNIIVNKGNATFDDIINLIVKIKSIVPKKLEEEIKIIGR